jgi:hypothetical protein
MLEWGRKRSFASCDSKVSGLFVEILSLILSLLKEEKRSIKTSMRSKNDQL